MDSTPTSTLGDVLRAKIQRDAEEAARKEQQKIDDAKALDDKETRTVRNFFEAAKVQFTSDILAGRALTGIQVGRGENTDAALLLCQNNAAVDRPHNRFHAYWTAFQNWADLNGLTAIWQYEHDGMGGESWYTLCVAPD
jgi:hypothetical protein